MLRLVNAWLPPPRILHPWPAQRFDVKHPSVAPHVGRGGWTWYTGSAGWLYRAGIEAILGFRLQGAFLSLAPCIPKAWPGFEIVFRYRSARYEIAVENPAGRESRGRSGRGGRQDACRPAGAGATGG
jgi:cellobiose phosphorylase